MSLSRDQVIILLEQEFKSLSDKLVNQDYENAIDDTVRETGWDLPVSGNEQEYWFKRRSKRHLFYMLLTESAHKFKFESINLQQRFDHYRVLVRDEDREWLRWSEANVHLLAGVEGRELFGSVVHGGFQYDLIGNDTTYSTDNEVELNPNDND